MDYTQLLIARYLKENGLNETLASFLKETDCSYSDIQNHEDYGEEFSLESIVKDRISFNAQTIEKKISDKSLKLSSWNYANTFSTVKLPYLGSLVIDSKFISTPGKGEILLLSSANRKTYIINLDNDIDQIDKWSIVEHKSVCKFSGVIENTDICYFITIDGNLILYDLVESREICKFFLNTRIVSHFKLIQATDDLHIWYFIFTGLDNKLKVAQLNVHDIKTPKLEIVAETKLLSKSTSLEVIINPDNNKPVIFVARQDYTSLLVFTLTEDKTLKHSLNIALNDAQFMSHSFNALDMKLIDIPGDQYTQGLLIATSHSPYMRLIVVNVNDIIDETIIHKTEEVRTYYDKVLENIVTGVPQDAYSQPIIATNKSIGGILIGSNDGLYAIDLNKKDSWKFQPQDEKESNRIKTVDVNNNGGIIVSTAEKELFLSTNNNL